MVDHPERGLEYQDTHGHKTDDGVVGGQEAQGKGHPDAHAHTRDGKGVGQKLDTGVRPDGAAEMGRANDQGAKGKEEEERERQNGGVGGADGAELSEVDRTEGRATAGGADVASVGARAW